MLKRLLSSVMLCASLCIFTACASVAPEVTISPEETTGKQEKQTYSAQEATLPAVSLVALEVGGTSDSLAGGVQTDACEFWSPEVTKWHQSGDAAETLTVTVDGVSYSGSYNYSSVNVPETFRTDYYTFVDGYGNFAVNSATGELVHFMFASPSDLAEGDLTAEECREAANAFASLFVEDLEQYTLTVTPGVTLHTFSYRKYINGIATGECFNIGVTTAAGEARLFSSCMLGAFNAAIPVSATASMDLNQTIDLLSSEQADAVLDEK